MENYNIVYCGSDFVATCLASSIGSILQRFKAENTINFHILDFGVSQTKKDNILALVNQYNMRNKFYIDKSLSHLIGGGELLKNNKSQFSVSFRKPILGRANKEKLAFYSDNYKPKTPSDFYLHKLFLQDIFADLDYCLFLSHDITAKECISNVFNDLDFGNSFAIVSKNNSVHKIFENGSIFLHLQQDYEIKNFCKHFDRKVYFDPDMMLLNLKGMRNSEISQQFYAYALYNLHSPYKREIDSADGILRLGFEDCIKVSSF